MDRAKVIIAGIGIGLPVGFALYMLWTVTGSMSAVMYGGIFLAAAGLLFWSGAAIMDRRDKR